MSVLVLVENMEGSFKKKSFELVQYASKVAADMGTQVTALVLGSCSSDAMSALGAYGAAKVLHVSDARLDKMSARAYTKAVVAAAAQCAAKVIIAAHDVVGKSVAPQVA